MYSPEGIKSPESMTEYDACFKMNKYFKYWVIVAKNYSVVHVSLNRHKLLVKFGRFSRLACSFMVIEIFGRGPAKHVYLFFLSLQQSISITTRRSKIKNPATAPPTMAPKIIIM